MLRFRDVRGRRARIGAAAVVNGMETDTMQISVITVPYRYDEPREGLGLGPDALLAAGLVKRLVGSGHVATGPSVATLEPDAREDGRTALNIGKLGASTAALVRTARDEGRPILVLAGDDTASVGVVAGLQQSAGIGGTVGIVWLDAHGDFNTPETSFSGILAGMPMAILAGLAGPLWRGAAGLVAPIPTDRMLIAGVRELDEREEALLRSTSVQLVSSADIQARAPFQDAVDRIARQCAILALHIDLDLLDPHLIPSATTPSAKGLSLPEAVEAISYVLRTGRVAVVTLASLNPGGGQRGSRSIATALELLTSSLAAWTAVPPASDAGAVR